MKNLYLFLGLTFLIPFLASAQTTIYSNDFSNGSGGWTLDESQVFDLWIVNNNYSCSVNTPDNGGGNYLHISDDLDGDYCDVAVYLESAGGDCFATMTSDVSTVGYSSVSISFSWLCSGENAGLGGTLDSYGTVWYSIDGGGSWVQMTKPVGNFWQQSSWTTTTISSTSYPALAGQAKLRLRFGWVNSGVGNDPSFGIDNLVISGTGGTTCTNAGGTAAATVQSICNGQSTTVNLTGSTGTIQWQQSTDNKTWANVTTGTGATTTSYTTPDLTGTMYYRADLSQSSCPDQFSSVATVTVNPNVTPTITISADPGATICNGTTVNFTSSITNGGTNPAYHWNYQGQVSMGPTLTLSSFTTGDRIYCNFTSSAACANPTGLSSNVFTMTVNPVPVASAAVTGATCSLNNGSIDLSVSKGTAPYTYVWSNNAVDQDQSNIGPGKYKVTVTDMNGCTTTDSATVTSAPAPTAAAVAITATCGSENGSVNLTVTGNSGPYTYLWSNAATTQNLSNVGDATFTVTVTDVNGCTTTASATVTNTVPPTANTVPTGATCNNKNGNVTLTVTGTTNPYTYLWSNSATTQNLSNVGAASYTVTITDKNGCAATASSTVTNTEPPTLSASAKDASCGNNNGSITLAVSGTTMPYTFLWSNNTTTQNISDLAINSYTVTVTDVNGCTATISASIGNTGTLTPAVSISVSPASTICTGTTITFTAVSVNGGFQPVYQWQVNSTNVGAGDSSFVSSALNNGDVVSVSMVSALSCASPTTARNSVTISVINGKPSTPVATGGTNATSTSIVANWNTAAGATNYYLDVSTANTFSSFVSGYNNLNVGNVTLALVTGLTQGTTYYYRVRAANLCGTTPASDTITYSTGACEPLTGGTISPDSSVICSGSTQTLILSGITGSSLQWQISSNGSTWTNVTSGGNTSSYTTQAGDGSAKKYYRCLATNGCYEASSPTAIVDVSVTPVIKITNVTSTTATFTWSPYAAGQYNISWSGAGTGTVNGVNTNSYVITGLTPNQNLQISVTPVSSSCGGVKAGTAATRTECAVPVIIQLAALNSPASGFKIKWNTVSGVTTYRVYYRNILTSSAWSFVDTAGSSKTILASGGGITYAVYVAAKDCPSVGLVGEGTPVLYVTTNPSASCSPAPTVSASSNCPNQVTVNISGSNGPWSLMLRRISPSMTAVATYAASSSTVNISIGTQAAGSVWEVFARTNCGGGSLSDASNIAVVTIKPSCAIVSNLVLGTVTCNGFIASWNTSNCLGLGVLSYQLLIKKNGTLNYNSYAIGNTDHKLVNWLTASTVYDVTVLSQACNGSVSSYSVPDTISLPACREEVEANEPVNNVSGNNDESVLVYPNPSSGQFWVNLGSKNTTETSVKIELINLLGRVVQTNIATMTSGNLEELIAAPDELAGGIYFVRTSVGDNVYVNRVMISRE